MIQNIDQDSENTQAHSPRLNRRELITYAFISQGIFGLDDRLTGLLPFFEPILRERQGSIFDPSEFTCEVNARYPWSINADITQFLIPRFVQAGWLRGWKTGEHEAAYAILSFPPLSDNPAFARAQETLSKIGRRFKEFTADVQPLFVTSYEQVELEELLLRWIVERRACDSSALLEAAKRHSQSSDQNTEPISAESFLERSHFRSHEEYLCGRFVEDLSSADQSLFDDLVQIAAVALVTEVALDVQKPQTTSLDLRSARFYLDGPFTMDLLGLSGIERRDNARYIVDKLRAHHGQLYVMRHSCDEIREIIAALFRSHPHDRYGPTADALRKGVVLEAYVKEVMADVSRHVESNNPSRRCPRRARTNPTARPPGP